MSASEDQKLIVMLRAALRQISELSQAVLNDSNQAQMSRALNSIHSIAQDGGPVLSADDRKAFLAE